MWGLQTLPDLRLLLVIAPYDKCALYPVSKLGNNFTFFQNSDNLLWKCVWCGIIFYFHLPHGVNSQPPDSTSLVLLEYQLDYGLLLHAMARLNVLGKGTWWAQQVHGKHWGGSGERIFIDVGLLRVHLHHLGVDIYNLLYWGRFYVWASGLCSLNWGFRYIEVCCIEVLLHTFYSNFGRAEGLH